MAATPATAATLSTEGRTSLSPSKKRNLVCLAGIVAAVSVGACILNPQPLPPESSAADDPGSSSGRTPTVADGGTINQDGDARALADASVVDAALDSSPDGAIDGGDAAPSDAGDAGD